MGRRGLFSRSLRWLTTASAVIGLLGHGLAMLVVSVLPQDAGAARPEFSSTLEICTASGIASLATDDSTGRSPGSDSGPGPKSGKYHGCPICNAFAQVGHAALPAVLTLAPQRHDVEAPAWPVRTVVYIARGRLPTQPRAPPVAA